ncbi:Hydroquinone glucosyltransferase [Bienertia sinuspersici]
MCLSLFLHLPQLDAQVSCEFKDMHEPIQLPGCIPVHGKDLVDPFKIGLMMLTSGCFIILEEGALKILQNHESGTPPIYPVGPLVQTGSGDNAKVDGSECLKWLDEQPRESVLFVSFGSGGTLSYNQILELAHGLEISQQKFLWVLRSPNDETFNATYFSIQGNRNDPLVFLPKGFLDRTKEQGLVIPMWAPQIKVLSHAAIAGFLSHCGWNSILESVVNGVPLIAWPLYAEQKMNAIMLTKGMNVAIRPNVDEKGLISREEIAKIVKRLMDFEEGKVIRNQVNDLMDAAARAVGEDGSSTKALYEVDGSECLKWLDEQPRESVSFVSFGSGGTLSYNQILELAHGLEISQQKFLWVLRSPNDETFNATYFSIQGNRNDPLVFLPNGFLDRTKEQGLVIPMWAPQIKVLSHAAIGGFLSHCGWNSILESVVNGVPLIAWPLYAEQKMNAIMLTKGMNVAIRPNVDEKGLISREEIAKIVKRLMDFEEGKVIQNQVNDLMDAAATAVGEDGSSTKALYEVVQKWTSH